jgi:hypothetical protein
MTSFALGEKEGEYGKAGNGGEGGSERRTGSRLYHHVGAEVS